MQSLTLRWVHLQVDMLVSSQGLRLGGKCSVGDQLEAERGVATEVLICSPRFARHGDFSFQKAMDFLEF